MTDSPIPPQIQCLTDYIEAAAARVPAPVWAYVAGSGADGRTKAANSSAFAGQRLRPRALRDLRGGHTRLRVLGQDLAHPILVAPTAFHRLLHPEGEHATVTGAAATQTLACVSCQASTDLDDLAQTAQTAKGQLWFQLYLQPRRADTETLVRRAEAAGYGALVVTIDAPINGMRNAEVRAGFKFPRDIAAVNLAGFAAPDVQVPPGGSHVFDGYMAMAPVWEDLQWLRGLTDLPLLIKGVLTPEDAVLARDAGADAVIVSNHGGRVLDGLPPTLEALPLVRAAVGADFPLLVDGGIRRGTDVLIARALGADAVLLGLPVLAALAVGGAVGVAHALHILRTELEVAMALTGCKTWAEIGPEVLWP